MTFTTVYNFDPVEFGFENAKNFPEIEEYLAVKSFVKVIAIGPKEIMGRPVYWYCVCSPMSDDRWEFLSDSYDSNEPNRIPKLRTVYQGLISNYNFAEMLLKHIFGTSLQKSVEEEGLERLNQNINKERLE
jgi:hypothetical protein